MELQSGSFLFQKYLCQMVLGGTWGGWWPERCLRCQILIALEKLNFYLFFHIKKPGCSYQAIFLPLLYLPCVVGRKAFSQAIRKFLQHTRLWGEKTILMCSFNAVAHYGRHQLRDSSMHSLGSFSEREAFVSQLQVQWCFWMCSSWAAIPCVVLWGVSLAPVMCFLCLKASGRSRAWSF